MKITYQKKILLILFAVFAGSSFADQQFASIPNLQYETTNSLKDIEKTPHGESLKKFVDSTYWFYYKASGNIWSMYAIAVAPNKLLTASHNVKLLVQNKINEINLCTASQAFVDCKTKYKIQDIKEDINNSDLALITFTQAMQPINHIESKDIYANLDSYTKNDGMVYAFGMDKEEDSGFYSTKLTGINNFASVVLPDVKTGYETRLIASLKTPDINNNQIDAIQGDSGGPWILCAQNICKLSAIQSWRGDKHENEEYHNYRSVAVPIPQNIISNL